MATNSLINEKRYYLTGDMSQLAVRRNAKLLGVILYNGKYMRYNEIIAMIANNFAIYIGKTEDSTLYTTSQEDYDIILRELNNLLK